MGFLGSGTVQVSHALAGYQQGQGDGPMIGLPLGWSVIGVGIEGRRCCGT
jgi:hypothetical protein